MILPVRGATTSDVIAVWSILLYHTPLSNNDANSRHDVMTSLLSDVSFFFERGEDLEDLLQNAIIHFFDEKPDFLSLES